MRHATRRPVALVATCALVAGVAGCDAVRMWRARRDVREALARSDAAAAAVAVPEAPADGQRDRRLQPIEPATRVLVTRDGIAVHSAPLVAHWWGMHGADSSILSVVPPEDSLLEETVVELDAGTIPASALRDGAAGHLVTPLHDALLVAVDLEKTVGAVYGQSFSGRMEIRIAGDVPFATVMRVLYTAGQAEFSRWDLVLEGLDGPGSIRVEAPRFMAGGPHRPGPECLRPFALVVPDGVLVRARASRGGSGGSTVELEVSGKLLDVLGSEGAAPGSAGEMGDPDSGPGLAGIGTDGDGVEEDGSDDGVEEDGAEGEMALPTKEERRKQIVDKMNSVGILALLGSATEDEATDVLGDGAGGIGGIEAGPPPKPDWRDRLIVDGEKRCPSVPDVGGIVDTESLIDLVLAMGKLASPCASFEVTATPDAPWERVAAVIDALVLGAGFGNAVIVVSEGGVPEASDCSDAVRVTDCL